MIKVGITQGDYNGVGYEVIAKSLSDPMMLELMTPVVFGYRKLLRKAFESFCGDSEVSADRIAVVEPPAECTLKPGQATPEAGKAAFESLEQAVQALKEGRIDVLVTAPICKADIHSEDFHFPGHTEYLEDRLGGGAKARMILFSDKLRVMLVTTHLPLSEVPAAVTEEGIEDTVKTFDRVLRQDFGVERPKIAVLSLNPHAGDGGLLGSEEKDVVAPAVERCRAEGLLAFGPYPVDGFFASGHATAYDGIVALYHDQGLGPFKALARQEGVNFTSNLPYVRTSPDHGTAFDIAWKGEADPTSMREAIYAAIDLERNRRRYLKAARNPLRKVKLERGADKTVDFSKESLD